MRIIISIVFFAVLLFSCKKSEDRKCWKFAGDSATKEIALFDFDSLELGGKMRFVLIQDSLDKIVINGYENLNNLIVIEQTPTAVKIENENKCNYLRNFDKKVELEIHFTDLKTIYFRGSEYLINKGTLVLDEFELAIRDGAGPVNLNVDANKLKGIVLAGHGDFTFSGNCNFAYLRAQSAGYFNSEELSCSDSLHVSSSTVSDVFVNATSNKFITEIASRGDIYYKGTSVITENRLVGEGQVINNN